MERGFGEGGGCEAMPVAGREVIAYFIYMLGRLEASYSLASVAM